MQKKPVIITTPPEVELIPPQKPQKADDTKPSFVIIIEPGSVREITVYNNMKFEVDEDEKNFNPKNNIEYWDDVKVENTEKKGTYRITFTSKNETVSYLGRPVYEGKNYEEALKEFEVRQREYEKLISERLTKEKKEREKIEKENQLAKAKQEQIDKMKELIAKHKAREQKKKEDLLEKWQAEAIRKENARQKKVFTDGGSAMSSEIFRTFTLQGFGAWNIDKPALQQTVMIAANYIDKKGKPLDVKNVNVAYNNFNGIFSYQDGSLGLIPNSGNTILGVIGRKFAYLTADEFMKCNIDSTTRNYTFTMNVYEGNISSREDIKRIVRL